MKALKIILLSCITFLLFQCGSRNFNKKSPFKVQSATYYNSATDLQENTNSNLYIRYSSKNNINFDSLYFRKNTTKLQTKTIKGIKYVVGEFQKKIFLRDFTLDVNPINELKNKFPTRETFPFELQDNEAIISYQLKGKTKYFKVKNIKKRAASSL